MSSIKQEISGEVIERFLSGNNPMKYVVAIEATYHTNKIDLVINDPEKGKYIKKHDYSPFLWMKHDITTKMYGGARMKIIEACKKFDVKITQLRTKNDEGITPKRLENGYVYLVKCKKSYNDLINFFKYGGIDVFNKNYSKSFMMFSPVEQFMIQTGIRLFKGMDNYNDVHRLQFDLETEGLDPKKDAIFQIGIRDNKGLEGILEAKGNTHQEKRDAERDAIIKFFQTLDIIKPDIITGYNSETFDWDFLYKRCERLSIPITDIAITRNKDVKIKRKEATLKLGNESEKYLQTYIWGTNVIDIAHSVRRAQAINSDIKSWSLKYITKYANIAKPNRVYVPGDKINSIWKDTENQYAFNDKNGDWYKITPTNELKNDYEIVTGSFIIQRYLLDDLWETEHIDSKYNQASFLIAKLLPTNYMRSSTMGTAGQWKLLMSAWSYENNLAIPETEPKRDFTGGLSRLLQIGYSKNVDKLDFAALYPKIELTHDIFPDLDISGVMKGLLTYIVDTRDKFKFLTEEHKEIVKKLEEELEQNINTYSKDKIDELKKQIKENKNLASSYDVKQLPLKILANSWFGSYGAPYIFNWGESDSAESTTCHGRQYLRLMVRFFTEKYGFRPLLLDTDGVNFATPENINDVKYVAKGTHWKTTKNANVELSGVQAVLAEFNETYMKGRMGLDLDATYNSTINFARKNYANDLNGKVKLVGNSIKSKKMPTYIEEFLAVAIRLLLDGKGYEFIQYYYEYVDKIYNYQIPLVKIASKSKVKSSIDDYKKKATQKNKKGNPMPKQAHMELVMNSEIPINLGDIIYYVNTGKSKSHGDLKSVKNKETGLVNVELNCKLISNEIVENDTELIKELEMLRKTLELNENSDEKKLEISNRIEEIESGLITDEYNVARYLAAFNKKIAPLLVCFDKEIRKQILLTITKKKNKLTKETIEQLTERAAFTQSQCVLVSGQPDDPTDQDRYIEDLMLMEDKEIKFWSKVNMVPNNMEESEWLALKLDYEIRMENARIEGVNNEKNKLNEIFKRLEITELNDIIETGMLPIDILSIVTIDDDGKLISRKWNEILYHIDDIFMYELIANKRNEYYIEKNLDKSNLDRYEQWLDHETEIQIMTGNTNQCEILKNNVVNIIPLIKEKSDNVVIVSNNQEQQEIDYDDDEESYIIDDSELEPERPDNI